MKNVVKFIRDHKILIVLVVVIPFIILIGQKLVNSDNSGSSADQTVTAQVSKGNISSEISASGQVQTANYLAVTTRVNGIVKDVYVESLKRKAARMGGVVSAKEDIDDQGNFELRIKLTS